MAQLHADTVLSTPLDETCAASGWGHVSQPYITSSRREPLAKKHCSERGTRPLTYRFGIWYLDRNKVAVYFDSYYFNPFRGDSDGVAKCCNYVISGGCPARPMRRTAMDTFFR